jgi:DNA ligase (NAD+)
MLSLDKAYSETELRTFLSRVTRRVGLAGSDFVVEPKIDGLAISVTYEHGRLVRAVSRGNGDEGDDLTANVLTIRSLPRELRPAASDGSTNPVPDLVEIRGEIYLEFAEFERINRERESADEPVFANPRNLAAGTVRLLDPREVAGRRLSVAFYSWGAWEPAATQPATQHGFHEQVRRWGLPGLAEYRTVHGADEVCAAVEAFRCEREKLPYPVDGSVVKLDAVPLRSEFGESERAPRWALACKFVPASAEARIEAIAIQVGRTGLLTPVAELAPVLLAGSTVTRATLHNGAMIARLDVRVGDTVTLEKVGEIIPAVSGVVFSRRPADSRPYVLPAVCPACGTAVIRLEGEVAVRCPNPACPAQVRQRLRHFASRSCVKIDGLGPATIDALVAGGRVKNIADLYRLRPQDLVTAGLDRGKSAGNLIAAIERSKRAELWRFIYGLCIPRVGATTARDLARKFGTLEALAAAKREDFATAPDGEGPKFGAATVSAVLAHFSVPQNRAIMADLAALGVRPAAPSPDK